MVCVFLVVVQGRVFLGFGFSYAQCSLTFLHRLTCPLPSTQIAQFNNFNIPQEPLPFQRLLCALMFFWCCVKRMHIGSAWVSISGQSTESRGSWGPDPGSVWRVSPSLLNSISAPLLVSSVVRVQLGKQHESKYFIRNMGNWYWRSERQPEITKMTQG